MYTCENREGGELMRTKTKLLVVALLAVVTLAGAVSIIQTTAYNGSSQNCDDCNQLRQGNYEQNRGTEANAHQWRNRGMMQHGEQTGNTNRHCHQHGSDE